MKLLASRLGWWHTLPHKSTRGQRRRKGEASHGPYWHRRTQEGKPDLHPRRRGGGHRAADPHRARALRRRARGPAPARILIEASTDSEWVARCLEALGHEVIVADPNFAPMYATSSRERRQH